MTTTPASGKLTALTFPYAGAARVRRLVGVLAERPVFRAFARAILTVFVATSLTFFIVRLMPGNPIDLYINQLMVEQAISHEDAARIAGGAFPIDLDTPMHEQYVSYLGNLVRGDLGNSLLSAGVPVTALILRFLPWTIFAVGTALLLSFTVGILVGLLAAYHRDTPFDHVMSSIGSFISSIPDFLIALLLLLFLGVQWRLLPITQMRGSMTPGIQAGLTPDFIGDIFFHAALPIAAFFLGTVGTWVLSMKNATLATLEDDYVTAARARGLSDRRITTAYVGRNAILPLVTQLAISAGFAFGGAVVIELIFVYQGIGLLLLNAINQRDYPVMQGAILVITSAVVLANLLAELLYSRLDPRIGRAGGASGH
ncbi:MAG: ABC transporter permease [Candidatus Limnocylindria bacterium]